MQWFSVLLIVLAPLSDRISVMQSGGNIVDNRLRVRENDPFLHSKCISLSRAPCVRGVALPLVRSLNVLTNGSLVPSRAASLRSNSIRPKALCPCKCNVC